MTRDYSKGKIYLIRSIANPEIYVLVSSNIQDSISYLKIQKSLFKSYLKKTQKYYYLPYEVFRYGPAEISLIENYSCKSHAELEKRLSDIVIEQYPTSINVRPIRTHKDTFFDEKESILQKLKKKSANI